MIEYLDSPHDLRPEQLTGFFVGWPKPPSTDTHLKILKQSSFVVMAQDTETGRIVGFINAVSDRVLSAYIPLLEVLPEFQGRGIGGHLVKRLMAQLDGLYMIDLVCNEDLIPFYEKFGLKSSGAMQVVSMIRRDFDHQDGRR
ncbi:MAG: GNAT family N-acetyltransferase [candidate division Zixibacteria bacterium]|nr:GNAT family N-acetyltransferase [candidate division Zixibacteria bacterium]MDH3936454.1 GNAT family N-acetyltransferase [candidate division Zixibacteria bacterium]MDH4033099.1 GNAT family N-acetyltransferase [candidate division Zixibacteria bacterium]